jgi:hypothetical protein
VETGSSPTASPARQSGSVPDTWVTIYTEDMGSELADELSEVPRGFWLAKRLPD